jgi:MFS family permease
MLGLVAIAGALVEDAGFTWSASYMKDDLHAAADIAGFAFIGLMLLHFLGRIVGDKYVDRYGERAVARVGGVITAVGMSVALAWPTIPGTIVGFSLAGLGVATTVPAAFAASDGIPGLRPGTGITMVSWMLRISFLASPPIVGAVADATSLRTGLLVVPIAGIAVFLLAGALKGKAPHDDAPVAVITPAR